LHRAARGTGGPRACVPDGLGHRGAAPRLSRLGRGTPTAAHRPVRLRARGPPAPASLPRPRPLRGEAALHPSRSRLRRLRVRGAAAGRAARPRPADGRARARRLSLAQLRARRGHAPGGRAASPSRHLGPVLARGGARRALLDAAGWARRGHGRLNRAFFLDFEERQWSEREAAQTVADRLGLPLESATLTPAALEDFLKLVAHADDPLADSSALAVWTIARQAAKANKVVLGGDGGDELYGGYLTYGASRLHARVISRIPSAMRSGLAAVGRHLPTRDGKVSLSERARRFLRAADLPTAEAHFTWNGTWLPEEAAAMVEPGETRALVREALPALARRAGLRPPISVRRLQLLDVGEYLPNDILAKVDR